MIPWTEIAICFDHIYCLSQHLITQYKISLRSFNRGRGTAGPLLCPLLFLLPSVRRGRHLRPGAGQQHLQKILSGKACVTCVTYTACTWLAVKRSFSLLNGFVEICLCAGPFVRPCPPSRGSALPWNRCRICRCWATTCWGISSWLGATTAGFSSHLSSRVLSLRRRGFERATIYSW